MHEEEGEESVELETNKKRRKVEEQEQKIAVDINTVKKTNSTVAKDVKGLSAETMKQVQMIRSKQSQI